MSGCRGPVAVDDTERLVKETEAERAANDMRGTAAAVNLQLLGLADVTDARRCGGKAAGLAALMRARLPVPAGVCLTTDVYGEAAAVSGVNRLVADLATSPDDVDPNARLATIRARIERLALRDDVIAALREEVARLADAPHAAVAVRSSAPHEDGADASHAGVHASVIVAAADHEGVVAAVKTCWASLWSEAAWAYRQHRKISPVGAAMAVVVQRFVDARRSGVAFSTDPVTGDDSTVVIESVWGSGGALMAGRQTPDRSGVTIRDGVRPLIRRQSGRQDEMTLWRNGRHVTRSLSEPWRQRPTLTDTEVVELARLVKQVERALRRPADVEWVYDGRTFWIVQARPITAVRPPAAPATPPTVWTRANLKEILPDRPSPLALSYVSKSMNLMFESYHAAAGYTLPRGARLVDVFRGRPYLNLTLMRQLTADAGGDPRIVARLLGGADEGLDTETGAGVSRPHGRLRLRTLREALTTFFRTPRRARRLFDRLYGRNKTLRAVPIHRLDDRALVTHLERFRATLLDEATMRSLHEVVSAQSRAYMVLETLLAAWIPGTSVPLVTRLMTGLGTLPNIRMTYGLMELGALALEDPRVRAMLDADPEEDGALRNWDAALAGTEFRAALGAFLREFGHRGPYESDVMSPRFEEDPLPLLRLIQLYVRSGGWTEPVRHAAERRFVREAAMGEVRAALAGRSGPLAFAARWAVFSVVCTALQQLLALRDECRHVTTMLVAHLRRLALEIGARATQGGRLGRPDDVFFLTWDELPHVLIGDGSPWERVVRARREEYERNGSLAAPDLLVGEGETHVAGDEPDAGRRDRLVGFGVSPGIVTGRVRIFRSVADLDTLSDDIIVFSAIEPTLTPLLPLVRGMIAEMGGLLSHAAILAREYGVPTVVSVRGATHALHEGDRVEMDGTTGSIRVLERAA